MFIIWIINIKITSLNISLDGHVSLATIGTRVQGHNTNVDNTSSKHSL